MRSSAVTIWLKLAPAARNSCGPASSSGCWRKFPGQLHRQRFSAYAPVLPDSGANHNSSGVLTNMVTISSNSGRSNSKLMKSD